MKLLKNLLNRKNFNKKTNLDKKTVFYIFEKVIKREYGKMGGENIKPSFYKKGKIFIKTQSSNWANEIWLNRQSLIKKINQELGSDEIKEIK